MVELAYTMDLKSIAARIEGSNPSPGTILTIKDLLINKSFFYIRKNNK